MNPATAPGALSSDPRTIADRSQRAIRRRLGRSSDRRARSAIPPFQVFLDEHRTLVYRYLLATVGPNDSDDCFQETFLSALRAYPRLKDAANLRAWIIAIATRKAIDAGRARSRRPVPVSEVEERASVEGGPPTDADQPLWRAVRALAPRQRTAVVQRFVLDQTYREIASAMGCSEQAARANVYQGLRKLREGLGNEDE